MKKFEIKALGLEEMSAHEMRKTNGGIIWKVIIGVIGFLIGVHDNRDDIQQGENDAKRDYQNQKNN